MKHDLQEGPAPIGRWAMMGMIPTWDIIPITYHHNYHILGWTKSKEGTGAQEKGPCSRMSHGVLALGMNPIEHRELKNHG